MYFQEKALTRATRLAIIILANSLAAAHAQQAADNTDNQPQRVIVTGSNIKTIESETASPVQVLKRVDIDRMGVTNVADLIGNLSASTGGLSDISGSSSFAPGATNVSLRNLGEQSTLVLVNGRRMPYYALADFTNVFTNVDTIPIDAIDRVEVLKTGASAIYGSDAVAGVINIITRTDMHGVEVSADRTQSIQDGTFGTTKASISAGFGDLDKDGYNVMLNADFYKRDSVMWTNLLGYTNPALTMTSPAFGSYSSYSYPGNIIDGSKTQPVAGCASNLIIGGLCKYNRYARLQAVPESDRNNFFGSGTYNLGGGTQAFGEAMYSKITTDYISAFPYYGDGFSPAQWGNPATGQSLTMNYLTLPANSPLNPTGDNGVGFRYRFVDAPSYQDVDSSQYRVLGGLRGTYKDYDWETAAGVMGSKTQTTQQGAYSSSGFIQEIGNYNNYTANTNPGVNQPYVAADPNFFNQPNGYHPGQTNSASVINTLFPVFGYTGKETQTFVDGKVSGPLFNLPAGMVNFAAGGEVRHESYSNIPTENLATGDIVGYGVSTSDASRTTEALYTELSIPIVKNLEAQAALRADKFPDLATHFSPKLALRYSATDSLLFRGTLEHGFRAPNLVESANSTKYAFYNNSDPQRCPQATALANALKSQAAALPANSAEAALLYARAESVSSDECNFALADEVKNNPALQPETSRGVSLGMVLEPVKGYSASIDYWNIDRKNAIGLMQSSQLLDGGPLPPGITLNRAPLNPNTDPVFTAAEIAQYGVTAGPLLNVIRELENISEQKTSGIDL
jgi:iron complex outermembrane receptor protein